MEKRNSSWRRAAAVAGVSRWSFAACSSPSGSGGTGKSVTVIGTWGGDEEKAFKAMVAPWEAENGQQRQVHGHPRPQRGPDNRRRLGRPARPGRPAGPGPDGRIRQGRLAQAARRRPRHRQVQGRDGAGARRARHGRRQDLRRLHQGRREGPDLVQPQAPRLRRRPRRRRGTTSQTQATANKGDAKCDLVRRRRVRRGIRLAGHGLDRGHRPPPGRSRQVQPVVAGHAQVELARDQGRLRDLR